MKNLTGYPSIDRTHLQGIDKKKLNPTILPLNLIATFLLINSKHLKKPVFVSRQIVHTGYRFKNDVFRLAKALLHRLKPGSMLAIISENCYEMLVLTFAANAVGIRVAFLDPLATTAELSKQLRRYQAELVATGRLPNSSIDELYLRSPCAQQFIDLKNITSGKVYALSYREFARTAASYKGPFWRIILRHLVGKKDAIYLQTSGSAAGEPKRLPFTNSNIFASLMYISNSTNTVPHDPNIHNVLCAMACHLPYGWMSIFLNVLGGNTVQFPEDEQWWGDDATYIYTTPAGLTSFMQQCPEAADLSSITRIYVGGFILHESDYQEGISFLRHHGSKGDIFNNYGIGEIMCIGAGTEGIPRRPNTVGKLYYGPEYIIVNEALKEVKYNEPGELLVHSKSLCNGYFGNPEATAKAFITYRGKLFYRTGDTVALSSDGYVTFVGRKARYYAPVGVLDKVYCEVVERAINTLSDVVETSAVVPYHRNKTDMGNQAFVVLTTEYATTNEEARAKLLEHLQEALKPHELPDKINFLPQLPFMSSGKVNYVKLTSIAEGDE